MSNTEIELGKIPPQAIIIEEAVIGALMLDSNTIDEVIGILKPEMFYKNSHSIIYQSILNLHIENSPIDILTVNESLLKAEKLEIIGGTFFLTQLIGKIASSSHIVFHSQIIADKFLMRELIRISGEVMKMAFDDSEDVDDVMSMAESQIFALSQNTVKNEPKNVKDIIVDVCKDIVEAKVKYDKGEFTGIDTGFPTLNRMTGGWQNTDLMIIAARPSMGKTAIALQFLKIASQSVPVAFFSLEMSLNQLITRMISSECDYTSIQLRTGEGINEFDSIYKGANEIVKLNNVFIDDTPAIDILEIKSKSKKLVLKEGIKIIIVDYLQLVTARSNKGNREQEVSLVSRTLKELAKELSVPVIALSQLNRSVETRGGDKRPQMSDLRESGAIEQDADMVCFIHRPEHYGEDTMEVNSELINSYGMGMLICGKNRNGPLGDVIFEHSNGMTHFNEYGKKYKDIDYNVNENIESNFENEKDFDQF